MLIVCLLAALSVAATLVALYVAVSMLPRRDSGDIAAYLQRRAAQSERVRPVTFHNHVGDN